MLKSKDIVLIVIGVILSGIIAVLLNSLTSNFRLDSFELF